MKRTLRVVILGFLVLLAGVTRTFAAPFAFVSNYGDNTVSVIDLATNQIVRTVVVGSNPGPMTLAPDGAHMYVFSYDGSLSAIDTQTYAVITTALGLSYINDIEVTPDGNFIYATGGGANAVWIIDARTYAVVSSFAVPDGNHTGMVFNPSGSRLYVGQVGYGGSLQTVSVVDTASTSVIANIDLPAQGPTHMAIDPAGTFLYVAQGGYFYNGHTVTVIDTSINQVVASISVGQTPIGIAINSTGERVYVANFYGQTVSVIDTATRSVIATVAVEHNPLGIAVTSDDREIVVTNNGSNTVSIIDAGTNSVAATIPVGSGPFSVGHFVTQEALPAGPLIPTTLRISNAAFTYDGARHPTTCSAVGPNGDPVTPVTLTYDGASDPPIDAGVYAVACVFAGDGNYLPAMATASLSIRAATPQISVNGGSITFDGAAHPATATATGVNGTSVAGSFTVTYAPGGSALPVVAGSYTVTAAFTSHDANYTSATAIGVLTITVAVRPPVAIACCDQVIHAWKATVTLDGSGSFDPDARPLTYSWRVVSQPSATTILLGQQFGLVVFDSAAVKPTISLPQLGTYVFGLTVSDGQTGSAFALVTVSFAGFGILPPRRPSDLFKWDPDRGIFVVDYGVGPGTPGDLLRDGLPSFCEAASDILGDAPVGVTLDSGLQPVANSDDVLNVQQSLPDDYKWVGLASTSICHGIHIKPPRVDCPTLRQTFILITGDTPESLLVDSLPIPPNLSGLRDFLKRHFNICTGLDMSGLACPQAIELAADLSSILVPGVGAALDSPVAKLIAKAVLCGLDIDITLPDVSISFPGIDFGFGSGCWFGCGPDSGDTGGLGGLPGAPPFWLPLPAGTPQYDATVVPAGWATMTWQELLDSATAGGVDIRLLINSIVATTSPVPVRGFPFAQSTPVITPSGGPFTYDGGPHSFVVAVTGIGGVAVPGSLITTYAPGGSLAPVNAGSYTMTVTFTSSAVKYTNASFSTSFTIAAATPTVTASGNTFTYDGQPHPASAAVIGINGEVLGPLAIAYNGTSAVPKAAGTYAVTASFNGSGNYAAASAATTIIIARAPLTVKALDVLKLYGSLNPSFGSTITGFVPGEDASSLNGTVNVSTVAMQTTDVGSYRLTPSGITSPNYIMTFIDGLLTITPAPLTVTASDTVRLLGASTPAFSATYSGFVASQGPDVLGGMPTFGTSATTTSPAGTYVVVPGGLNSTNYAIAFRPGVLTITDNICLLFDNSRPAKAGSTLPIKLQVCDAAGTDVSMASVVLTATNVVQLTTVASGTAQDAGNSNPDGNFRFDQTLPGYVFNLKTTGLTTGTYRMNFTVAGDPLPHFITFGVK